jgi:hypothetical protein
MQVHRATLKEQYAIDGTIRDVAVKVRRHPPPMAYVMNRMVDAHSDIDSKCP